MSGGKPACCDITNFTIREMTEWGKVLRTKGAGAASMEETVGWIVRHFYDGLVDGDGERVCALVRFYKTHQFSDLDSELQDFARSLLGGDPSSPGIKCLVLLATAGDKAEWNTRKSSRGHKAIPLPSVEAVHRAPMLSNLMTQLGLPVAMVISPEPELLLEMEQKTFNVFHVQEAFGSPYIPAQEEFVVPCGIRSVLGFGGLLPSGEMFAVIIFFKIPLSRETADLFKALSLNVKMAVLPFERAVFSLAGEDERKVTVTKESPAETGIQILNSRVAALEQLIEVYENSVIEQEDKLLGEIAERKQAEEEIRRLNVDLEQKIEQLQEAQQELVRKEKLSILGQLSGSVGHELRNPLGVMCNAVYFLQMVLADADEATKEYLGIIKKEIDNSQRIITDLLDFARTKTPQVHRIAPRQLVEQSLEKCAFPENVALRTEIPESLPQLSVDPLQMRQVLQNLITNAVQAMPGGGTLRLGARKVSSSGFRVSSSGLQPETLNSKLETGFVEISVADTGVGISSENMKKLFCPLYTTKAKGIGLGLVVCRNLVEANGGRIEVESRPGEGTTFSVALPVETVEA